MINFTVGPVQTSEFVRQIGSEQVPYFRTEEFSSIMRENEILMKRFSGASASAKVVFITGSGTASMEAAVINTLTSSDKALIINGGSFGARFVKLCKLHDIPYCEIVLEAGKILTSEILEKYENSNCTALLVNVHETSTGVLYDIDMLSRFCKRNNMFFIVDAISSFLADDFSMSELGVDIMITSSQKALACPPGISMLVLSDKAIDRVNEGDQKCMYFDLKAAIQDGLRGQTPFTPAVGILRQINARLKEIEKTGGVKCEIERVRSLAFDFREKIKDLPLEIFSESMSNAVTPLHPINASAFDIFMILKNEYQIWVCPNGGEFKEMVFRVGHIGTLTKEDNTTLVYALKDIQRRGIL